jgi:hypothetical protein
MENNALRVSPKHEHPAHTGLITLHRSQMAAGVGIQE